MWALLLESVVAAAVAAGAGAGAVAAAVVVAAGRDADANGVRSRYSIAKVAFVVATWKSVALLGIEEPCCWMHWK